MAPLAYFAGTLAGADLAPIGRVTDGVFPVIASAYVPILVFALATLGLSCVSSSCSRSLESNRLSQ